MKKRGFKLFVAFAVALGMVFPAVACTGPSTAHTHNWAEATCTEPQHCTVCSATQGEALGHTGGTATCKDRKKCTRCGTEYGELTEHTGGTATCTTGKICTVCGTEYGERGAHTGGTATCTAGKICTVCGTEYGEALAHTGGTATCTALAVCSVCGNTYGELGAHNFVESVTAEATCDSDGRKSSVCTVCKKIASTEVLPKLTHKYVSKVEQGDCETDTVTTYTCSLCDDEYSEITARHAGHDYNGVTWTSTEEPEDGSECSFLVTETAKCKTCGETIERTYHKHVFTAVVLEQTESTCSEKGEIVYGCVCGNDEYSYSVEREVNLNAHDWIHSEKPGATHECALCDETKSEVSMSGTTAVFAEGEIPAEKPSIVTDGGVTLAPDPELTGKMTSGVSVLAEPVPAESFADKVSPEVAQKLENAPIYNFGLTKIDDADTPIEFGNGKMTISVPYDLEYGEDPSSVTVLYIADDGTTEEVPAVYGNGLATFTVTHFSHYAVVRLTAAERCAKLGHAYDVSETAATCTRSGFTVKSCRRCGDYVRIEGAPKLGHDHKSTEVPATCTEKGYTLMTCVREGCGDTYVSKYIPKTEHDYKDTVVAATCTAKGYTLHTCAKCATSFRDGYTDIVDHKYVNGECTVCHKKTGIEAANNYYLNLLESLSVNNYYVELSDVDFAFDLNDGANSMKMDGECEYMRFQVEIGDNRYIVGDGEGAFKYTMYDEEGNVAQTVEQKLTLAFRDGKIYSRYVITVKTEGEISTDTQSSVVSQDDPQADFIKQYIDTYYTVEAKKVLKALLDSSVKDSPIEAAIAKAADYLFDKTETDDGYNLVLDYAHVAEVIDYLQTHNVKDCFEVLFGKDSFDKFTTFLRGLPDMTAGELSDKLFEYAIKFNVKSDDIYDLADSLLETLIPDAGFTALDFITENSDKTIAELVEYFTDGGTTAAEFKETVEYYAEHYLPMFTGELSVVECICAIASREDTDGEIFQEFIALPEGIVDMLEAVNDAAKDTVKVVIHTDLIGAFEYSTVVFDKFALDMPLPLFISDFDGASVKLDADLSYRFTTEPGIVRDNGDLAVSVENARKNVVDAIKKHDRVEIPGDVHGGYGRVIVKRGADYWLLPSVDLDSVRPDDGRFEEAEYDGKQCWTSTVVSYGAAYKLDLEGEYSYMDSCRGWTWNMFVGEGAEIVVMNVYYDKVNGVFKPFAYDYNWRGLENAELRSYIVGLYYNAMQDKFSYSDPHNYVKIDEKEPATCEDTGCLKYRCAVCGDVYYSYYMNSHDWGMYEYELADADAGCEGGIVVISTCTKCGKEERHNEEGVDRDGMHRMVEQRIAIDGTVCKPAYILVYGCLCGEYVEGMEIAAECEFDLLSLQDCEIGETGVCEHGYTKHYTEQYKCAVTACGYTFTSEMYDIGRDANCYTERVEAITLANGKKYTVSHKTLDHSSIKEETVFEGDLTVYREVCENCNAVIRVLKFDGYDRTVYEYSYAEKRGREYVYGDDCHCDIYELEDENTRGKHIDSRFVHKTTRIEPQKVSCTQVHYGTEICELCGAEEQYEYYFGHNYAWNDELGAEACVDCGMKNVNHADGPVVLENLSTKDDFAVGYYNGSFRGILNVEFYTDYDDENAVSLVDGITYQNERVTARCGKIIIDRDAAKAWAEENPDKALSVVFVVDSKNIDGDKYPDDLEISITFTAEELATILGIEPATKA